MLHIAIGEERKEKEYDTVCIKQCTAFKSDRHLDTHFDTRTKMILLRYAFII